MPKTRSQIQQDKFAYLKDSNSFTPSAQQWNPYRAEKQIPAQASTVLHIGDFNLSDYDLLKSEKYTYETCTSEQVLNLLDIKTQYVPKSWKKICEYLIKDAMPIS